MTTTSDLNENRLNKYGENIMRPRTVTHPIVTSHTDTDWHAWCPTCGWAYSFPIRAWIGREHEITEAMNRLHAKQVTR